MGYTRADWPAWPCRTSSRRPSASPSRSRSCAASPVADSGTIGNFWVDLVRGSFRLLLPLAFVGAIVLIAGGVVQNFNGFTEVTHPHGQHAEAARRPGRLAGGDQGARHERRRLLQRQLRPPVREPDGVDEPLRDLCSCSIPFALPRTFGKMVGSNRQGYAILAAMATLFVRLARR